MGTSDGIGLTCNCDCNSVHICVPGWIRTYRVLLQILGFGRHVSRWWAALHSNWYRLAHILATVLDSKADVRHEEAVAVLGPRVAQSLLLSDVFIVAELTRRRDVVGSRGSWIDRGQRVPQSVKECATKKSRQASPGGPERLPHCRPREPAIIPPKHTPPLGTIVVAHRFMPRSNT